MILYNIITYSYHKISFPKHLKAHVLYRDDLKHMSREQIN